MLCLNSEKRSFSKVFWATFFSKKSQRKVARKVAKKVTKRRKLFVVVGFAFDNGEGAVELFGEDCANDLVREGHF